MWTIFLLLLVHIACGQPDLFAVEGQEPSPIDLELADMSRDLDGVEPEAPQAEAAPMVQTPADEADVSQMSEKDVKRFVDLEPGEQIALVQYNVAPQIISTRPGDKIAILPLSATETPCPTSTSKSPHPRMFCNSCGNKNPKEKGQITSYIDVDNSRECASLCARYISKGKQCDVWEYHGEWRNKQCFLLHIPDFPGCKGDVGQLGDMAFESGTCFEGDEEDEKSTNLDDVEDLEESTELMEAASPAAGSLFPRLETTVGSGLSAAAIGWKIALVAMILLIAGIALFREGSKRRAADYVKLLDNTDEV